MAEPEPAVPEEPVPAADLPEFEVTPEAEVPGAPGVPVDDAVPPQVEAEAPEPAMELEPSAVPEAPMEGLEIIEPGESATAAEMEGLEATVPVEPAPSEPAAEVEGLEPPVPIEGAEEVGVVADDLGLEPFDEDLAWDAGERTSRAISQEDLETAKEAHERALELVKALKKQTEIEAEKKAANSGFKTKLDDLDTEIGRLAEAIRSNEEGRMVKCEERYNLEEKSIEIFRTDVKEVQSRRSMTPAELNAAKQQNLAV